MLSSCRRSHRPEEWRTFHGSAPLGGGGGVASCPQLWMRRWVMSASHLRPQNTALPGARSCPLSHSPRWCPSFTETEAQGSGTALSQWTGPHSAPGAAACVVWRTGSGLRPVLLPPVGTAASGHPPLAWARGWPPRPFLLPRYVARWLPPSQAWHSQRPASLRSGLPVSLEADPLFGVLIDSAGSRSAFVHIN